MDKIHLATVILGVFVVGVVSQIERQTCLPDCTGKPPGYKVVDPKNCTQYYYCLNGEVPMNQAVWCESGHFEESSQDCTAGDCEPLCPPTIPSCHFACNGTFDMIRDPSDCTIFYYCLPTGISAPQECSEGTYFDGKDCVANADVCCNDICTPYCEAEGTQVPDPKDCTMYYICTGDDVPSENFHFPCGEGENFNIVTGRCEKDAPCKTTCSSSVSTSTPPTTTTTTTTTITTTESTTQTPISSTTSTTTPTLSSSTSSPTPSTPLPSSTTTPSPTPTSTTTVETTTAGCRDSYYCATLGTAPKCPSICQQKYFYCTEVGQYAEEYICTGDLVFNTDPNYPFCVLPNNCPYHPPLEE